MLPILIPHVLLYIRRLGPYADLLKLSIRN